MIIFFQSLILLLTVYFLLVFVGLRLVVPFMQFGKYNSPIDIPKEIRDAVTDLENKSENQKEYLQNTYNLILDKTLNQWEHNRFKAGTHLHRLFVKDAGEMWKTNKFLYCQGINYLAYLLLIGSKYFTKTDVKRAHVFLNFVLHQYLKVKVGEGWVDFDPAGAGIRGKLLGKHQSWFG